MGQRAALLCLHLLTFLRHVDNVTACPMHNTSSSPKVTATTGSEKLGIPSGKLSTYTGSTTNVQRQQVLLKAATNITTEAAVLTVSGTDRSGSSVLTTSSPVTTRTLTPTSNNTNTSLAEDIDTTVLTTFAMYGNSHILPLPTSQNVYSFASANSTNNSVEMETVNNENSTPAMATNTSYPDSRHTASYKGQSDSGTDYFVEEHELLHDNLSVPSLPPELEPQGLHNTTDQTSHIDDQQAGNDSSWATVVLQTLSNIRSLCQKPQVCDTGVLGFYPDDEACQRCRSCFCDDNCHKTEDCCLQYLFDIHRNKLEKKAPRCHSLVFNVPENKTPYTEYSFMIDSCRSDWKDDGVLSKCVNLEVDNLHDQWPVWSPVTQIIYRNKYCAKCNGEDESLLQLWDLIIKCENQTQLQALESFDPLADKIFIAPGCQLAFKEPPPIRSVRKLCKPTLPVKNSRFCVMDNFPDELPEKEEEIYFKTCDVFFDDTPINISITQSNLFCGLCTIKRRQFCNFQVNAPFPFMLVISPDALLDVTSTSRSHCQRECAPDEIYDIYESTCRKLQCALPRKLNNKRCMLIAKKTKGMAYQISLRLTPDITYFSPATRIALLPVSSELISQQFHIHTADQLHLQTNVFRIIYETKSKMRNDDNLDDTSNSLVYLTGIRLEIRVAVLSEQDTVVQERTLWNLTRQVWIVPDSYSKNIAEFHGAFMYSPWKEIEYVQQKNNCVGSPLTMSPTQIWSNGVDSEYLVDLTDNTETCPSSPMHKHDRIDIAKYLLLQDTLFCPTISFVLSNRSLPIAENHQKAENQNASDQTTITRDTGHLLHSVNANTGEVVLSVDPETGTVYHHPSRHNISFQYVELLQDGVVLVCAEQLYGTHTISSGPLVLHKFFSTSMIYVSVACQSLSVLCLFLVFFTYCLFAELRTLPGKNTMGLVASLLLAMLLFELGVAETGSPVVCVMLGMLIHFCLLSSFTWMVISCVHMHNVFTNMLIIRSTPSNNDRHQFARYLTASLLVPAIIMASTVIGNVAVSRPHCDLDFGYGRGICYLSNIWSLILASVLPICLAVLINLVLFLVTLYSLRRANQTLKDATKQQRQLFHVYFRMSTLTGINWLAGPLTAVIDSVIVWYIFIVLCGLQGLYVFVAFICNRRVISLYRALFCRMKHHGEREG